MDHITIILLCSDGSKANISCALNQTIEALRKLICNTLDCEDAHLRLIYCGKELKDLRATIKSSGIGLRENYHLHCAVKPTTQSKMKKAFVLSDVKPVSSEILPISSMVDLTEEAVVRTEKKRNLTVVENSVNSNASKKQREVVELL